MPGRLGILSHKRRLSVFCTRVRHCSEDKTKISEIVAANGSVGEPTRHQSINSPRSCQRNAADVGPKPRSTKAVNYDVTGEFYTGYDGSYIKSVFYRDVKNLSITQTLTGVTEPEQGATLFDSTAFSNASTGKTYGAELVTNQPVTFFPNPWESFGVYTGELHLSTKPNQHRRQGSAIPGLVEKT